MDNRIINLSKVVLICIAISLLHSCGVSFSNSRDYSGESLSQHSGNGECYAKCEVPPKIINVAIYNGTNINDTTVTLKTYVISKKTTKWIKKKADRNCKSTDPNDCLVWCLVEVPENKASYYTVIDTVTNKNFEYRNIAAVSDNSDTKIIQYQVVCENNIHLVISDVQMYLFDNDYEITQPLTNSLDVETQAALLKFQKEQNLPIGNLNYKTLEYMGIGLNF